MKSRPWIYVHGTQITFECPKDRDSFRRDLVLVGRAGHITDAQIHHLTEKHNGRLEAREAISLSR